VQVPEVWVRVGEDAGTAAPAGRLRDLFAPELRRRTLIGLGLASVGMATYWGAAIYGKDALRDAYARQYLAELSAGADAAARDALLADRAADLKHGEMLGMFLETVGTGLGLLAFAPLAEWLGRRGALAAFLLGGLAATLVLFGVQTGVTAIILFGLLTVGMGSGFAIYFPELFPTRLRGTGAGFCFNAGRILAAPTLFVAGLLQRDVGLSLGGSAMLISLLFLVGALLLPFTPETRGRELPA
jgi:hypothetical protein